MGESKGRRKEYDEHERQFYLLISHCPLPLPPFSHFLPNSSFFFAVYHLLISAILYRVLGEFDSIKYF